MREADKERVLVEVKSRVMDHVVHLADKDPAYLDNLIHEVIYFEERRLDTHKSAPGVEEDRVWLGAIRHRFKDASQPEKKRIVADIIGRHAHEVIGHFSEPVYQLTTSVVPTGLGVILSGLSPLKLVRNFPNLPDLPDVADNIRIEGEVEQLQALDKLGTIVLVPTHSSNLDSLVLGYSIFQMGLPPYTYGAGLNLFSHKMLGFFMHRLGAYKVDRLKQHSLYKEVLKTYATITLEEGYDNLFFPGGTRSRSGAIERKLKMGLLGCGLSAYYHNLVNGKQNPKVFIVPATLNYQLVLEAENLIDDHLKEAGKSRYIIEDDEFSMPTRIYTFMRNLVSLNAHVELRISKALDPFGNDVDMDGNSRDGHGRVIDIERYLYQDGRLIEDGARDHQYTRELADRIVEAYYRDNVAFSTHVVAWTIYRMLRAEHPKWDLYRYLRETAMDAAIPMVEVYRGVEETLYQLKKLAEEDRIRLSEVVRSGDVERVVAIALKVFGCYHTKPVLERQGDRIFARDMNLLYYYRNRLWGYGLPGSED
ncbi:MAG: 1-acyl-sn-glycerol-3-phosphate acyltransferase [Deltaproteobacteria bacterium]|nr:1-acyl-sn-glycerol-3-phosphate acyltransferase [Deltaproteobacteria bacterium]